VTLLRSFDDFDDATVAWVLNRADEHRVGAPATLPPRTLIGLAFLEPSLRTRVGFAAAAARLGTVVVEVNEVRASAISMPESVEDTLRTLGGYADLVVARVPSPMVAPRGFSRILLNGGDRGPSAEHPSQALVDLYALRQMDRPLSELTIAICGDLRMRAVSSLLRALSRSRPSRIVLATEIPLLDGFVLPVGLADLVQWRSLNECSDVDALYVAGIPHGALDEEGRTRLRVTSALLDRTPPGTVVLSPLPVIDEMEPDAVYHPRVRMFEQSDDGLFVRMALLEALLVRR
jgi:aspartate carbamoyltransferase catalytic subunit